MPTVLLIDIQNDFLPGGALPVADGDAVVPIANRLIASGKFSEVLATQDWHPAGHGSFASEHPGRKPGEVIDLFGLPQVLWPDHCVQNTGGACFAPGLLTRPIRRIFQKGTDPAIDSYSGLFDNGRRKSTGLADYLRARGTRAVFVCGLATDYCVKFTALDARREGFDVTLIVDACRGIDLSPGDVDRAIEEMRGAGVRVVTSAELL
ncbi:MAG TPA: bifunctional nicotinamidase/pyrazinamidase [Tepidisphaeraceae bacterium]|nr:bifunctional nicotinamidase/pyrazinamidase [Tepidisphaeraceae bacterium]